MTKSAKIIDLVTGMSTETDLEILESWFVEPSVTAIVGASGCPTLNRTPKLFNNQGSRDLDWRERVEPGSIIVLVENQKEIRPVNALLN